MLSFSLTSSPKVNANPHSSDSQQSGGKSDPLFRTERDLLSEKAPEQTLELDLTNTSCSVLIGVVASAAGQHVPLAGVGPHSVDAVESWLAWLRERCAFVNIWGRK